MSIWLHEFFSVRAIFLIFYTVFVFSSMLILFLFEFNSWIIIFPGNSQIDLRFDAAIAFFRRVLNRKRWEKISFVEDWCNCDWKLETFIYSQYLLWVLERFWNDIDIVIKTMTAKSSKIFFFQSDTKCPVWKKERIFHSLEKYFVKSTLQFVIKKFLFMKSFFIAVWKWWKFDRSSV